MNYRHILAASAACSLASIVMPATAQTIYTNRAAFNAATTGQVVSDFSSLGNGTGYGQNFAGTNWTLTASTGLIISYDPNSTPDYQFNSGKVLALAGSSPTVGTFTPGAGVTAFGFDFGVRAVNAGAGVTINGVTYTAPGAPALSFFGIVNTAGVGPIALSFDAARGVLDNVTVASAAPVVGGAVPEPATWGMMMIGFGAAGLAIRRRERIPVRVA